MVKLRADKQGLKQDISTCLNNLHFSPFQISLLFNVLSLELTEVENSLSIKIPV